MYRKALLAAAMAVSVSARIAVRQTATEAAYPTMDTSCITALASIASSEPTPPPELVSWELTYSVTDICSYSVPASISSVLEDYASEISSWYKHYSGDIDSALSLCPEYASDYSTLSAASFSGATATYSNPCKATGAGGSTSATATTGPSSTGAAAAGSSGSSVASGSGSSSSSSGSGSGSTATGNVGARETGLFAAVIGAAGLVGVIAAL